MIPSKESWKVLHWHQYSRRLSYFVNISEPYNRSHNLISSRI